MLIEIEKLVKELIENSNLSLNEKDCKKALLSLETYPLDDIQKIDMKEYILSKNMLRVDLEMNQEQIIILNNFKKKLIDRLLEKRQALYEKIEKLFKEEVSKEKDYDAESLVYKIMDVVKAIEGGHYSLLNSALSENKVLKMKICFLFGLKG